MKTLLERMKIEHVMCLKQEEVLYPNSVKTIFNDLKNNHFWMDLTYNTICMLNTYLKLKSHNPEVIDELFNRQ